MQTRCPQCQTVSPLEADRPVDRGSQFACPSCAAKFDAYAHLTEVAPGAPSIAADAPAHKDQGDLFAPRRPPSTPVPRFARQRVRISRPAQWRWWLASLVLAAILLAIIPIVDRDELARDAEWRPTMESLCRVAGCSLPPWSDLTAFEVTARDIAHHPSQKDARMITVSFRNNARFAQAWPLLELTFSDLNGRVVQMRRFRAQEYLGSVPESPLIAAGQSASATLEVVDPEAVSWDIEFR